MLGRFVHRYLDPADSLLEVLFGLIMALTVTVGARLLWERNDVAASDLVAGLAGCNVAWGLIDAAFYLLGARFIRNQRVQLVRRLKLARDDAEALAMVREAFDLDPALLDREEDRAIVQRSLVDALRHANASPTGNRTEEYVAAGLIAFLVSATALPGILPLLLVDDTTIALRISNAAQIGLLFFVGYGWAHYSGANRWRTGLAIALMGVLLVLVAVVLGG